MNDQSSFKGFGAPQQQAPTALSRLIPRLRNVLMGGAAIVTLGFLVWQKAAPDGWRPADIAGMAAGAGERHEIEEKAATKIDFDRRTADATSQPQAKSQVDVETIKKVLDERTASLQPETTFAGLADAFCLGGQLVASLTPASPAAHIRGDWRNPNSFSVDPDWHGGAVAVAQATCGVGDQVRAGITASQIDAVRTAAGARGAPMTDGAVKPTPVPKAPVAAVPLPVVVNLARAPHQHFSRDQQNALHVYASHLPADILKVFVDDLDMSNGWPEAWFDRVAYYQIKTNG